MDHYSARIAILEALAPLMAEGQASRSAPQGRETIPSLTYCSFGVHLTIPAKVLSPNKESVMSVRRRVIGEPSACL